MLQQTQVDRVLPYYRRFLERFPTVHELADAPTAEVIRIWSGLGYNRRAVNLQRAAKVVVSDFDGVFPTDVDGLRRLPGVGAYTAGAVTSFAYEQDVAFLDTNMRRVVSRVFFGVEAPVEKDLLGAARALVPPGQSWSWNQALIEFGALQCTARSPACIVCPLRQECRAFPFMQLVLGVERAQRRNGKARPAQPFETTNRYYRGRIVEQLRAVPEDDGKGIDLFQLGPRVRDGFSAADVPWLRNLVEGLERDGLAVISEASPGYDAGAGSGDTGIRVRLP